MPGPRRRSVGTACVGSPGVRDDSQELGSHVLGRSGRALAFTDLLTQVSELVRSPERYFPLPGPNTTCANAFPSTKLVNCSFTSLGSRSSREAVIGHAN